MQHIAKALAGVGGRNAMAVGARQTANYLVHHWQVTLIAVCVGTMLFYYRRWDYHRPRR